MKPDVVVSTFYHSACKVESQKHKGQKFKVILGYTALLWQSLYQKIT